MTDAEKADAIARREYFERAVEIDGEIYRHGICVRRGETARDDLIKALHDEWEQSLREKLATEAKG